MKNNDDDTASKLLSIEKRLNELGDRIRHPIEEDENETLCKY